MILLLQVLAALSTDRPTPNPVGQEIWSRVAVHSSGVFARAWTGSGPEVFFHVAGKLPVMVNVVTQGTQDEPEIQATPEGFIVAYDQRTPYMHIEARRFNLAGDSIGQPFQIDTQQTAWRPLASVRGDGLVGITYTGDYSNSAYVRLLDAAGVWLTSSLRVVPYATNRTDPCCAFDDAGNLCVVWFDHSYMSLRTRTLDCVTYTWSAEQTIALVSPGVLPWPVCRWYQGKLWVAWQGLAGVWLSSGVGSAPTLLGLGHLPELAPPFVVYENVDDIWAWSPSMEKVRINSITDGLQARPSATRGPNGALWAGWEGPGFNSTKDAFVRVFWVQ